MLNKIINQYKQKIKQAKQEKHYNAIDYYELKEKVDFILNSDLDVPSNLLASIAIEIHKEGFFDKNRTFAQLTENKICKLMEKVDFNQQDNNNVREFLLPHSGSHNGSIDIMLPLKSNWIKVLYRRPSIELYERLKQSNFFDSFDSSENYKINESLSMEDSMYLGNQNTNVKNQSKDNQNNFNTYNPVNELIKHSMLMTIFLYSFDFDYQNMSDKGFAHNQQTIKKQNERTQIVEDMSSMLFKNEIIIQKYYNQATIEYNNFDFSSQILMKNKEKALLKYNSNASKTKKCKPAKGML